MRTPEKRIAFNLRLPDKLHSELITLATNSQRSLNKQIEFILAQYIAVQKEFIVNYSQKYLTRITAHSAKRKET